MSKYHPPASDDTFDELDADEERRQRALGIHPLQKKAHHIRRKDGVWEVYWGKELAASSPHGVMDAWQKCCDWHGRMAAEAWQELRRLENEQT